jgi:hypothetical protein
MRPIEDVDAARLSDNRDEGLLILEGLSQPPAHHAIRASSKSFAKSSGLAGRGESLVTRC